MSDREKLVWERVKKFTRYSSEQYFHIWGDSLQEFVAQILAETVSEENSIHLCRQIITEAQLDTGRGKSDINQVTHFHAVTGQQMETIVKTIVNSDLPVRRTVGISLFAFNQS